MWRSLGSKERVVALLLGHGRQGAVAARQDRVSGQPEDLLDVILVLVGVVGRASPHRAREQGVAHDPKRVAQARYVEGRLARGVPPGGEGLDRDLAKVEM